MRPIVLAFVLAWSARLSWADCVDTNPPALFCPSNIIAYAATGQCSKTVSFTVTSTNRCDPSPVITCNPPSGFTFPVGKTIVTCAARDASSNTASCNFSVTVFPAEIPPAIQWQQSFGGTQDDYLLTVQQTSDGGYVLGGTSYSQPSGNKTSASYGGGDYWVVRLDSAGNKLWEQSFGGSGDDVLFSVHQTSDGGFVLGGTSASSADGNKTSPNYGGYDYWIVRLDSSGNKLWDQSFGGYDDDGSAGVYVRQTSDGGFIVGGDSRSGPTGSKASLNYGGADFWVLRLDANGNELWEQAYGGFGDDSLQALQQTSDGGFLFAGYSASGPSGNKTNANFGSYDFWVMRANSGGGKIWDQAYGGSGVDQARSLQITTDGGLILGGGSSSAAGGNKISTNIGGSDFWAVRADSSGNKLWDLAFGGSGFDEIRNVQQASDGGYILGGISSSSVGSGKSATNYGGNDYWVVRLDATGSKIWDLSFGAAGMDNLYSLKQTRDNGYILGGYSTSAPGGNKTASNFGGADFWVIKLAGPIPTIICPTQLVVEATSPAGAQVTFSATATNMCQPSVPVVCVPASGSTFPLGTNLVTCTAVDAFSVTNQRTFAVIVQDTTRPILVCPPPVTTNVDLGQCVASHVNLGLPTASDAAGSVTVTNNAPAQFPFGVTPVLWTATDLRGNFSVCTQSVTVAGPPPVIVCPGDMALIAATGQCSLAVNYTVMTSDSCDPAPVVRTFPPPGATFPVGKTIVSCSASNSAGVVSTCSFVVSVFPITQAPAIQWQQSFGGGSEDNLQALLQTPDGGFLIGGYSLSSPAGNKTSTAYGNYDYWVLRLDAAGTKIWENSFGGNSYDALTSLQLVGTSGSILGGTSSSGISGNKTTANNGGYDFWIVRLDNNGNKVWEKTYGGNDNDWLYSALPTKDGGFILGGWSVSLPSGNKSSFNFGSADFWVLRLDSSGNKIWDQSFGGSGYDALYTIIQTSDGGFLLGGTSASPPGGNKSSQNYGDADFWIVRLDSSGNKLWDQSYGGSGSDALFSMQQTADGGFVLAGYSSSGQDGTKTSPGYGDNDFWIVRIDAAGNQLWDKSFGGIGTDGYPTNPKIQLTSDGGFILGGQSTSLPGGNKGSPNIGSYDYWILHLDSSGNVLWEQTIGGTGYDALAALQQTSDGGYALGGTSYSDSSGSKTNTNFGGGDYWIVKLAGLQPAITAPTNIVAELTGPTGAAVNWTVSATNLCQASVPLTSTPVSGSTFPLGTNLVTVVAVDALGYSNVLTFPVIVRDTTPPSITAPPSLLTNTSAGRCFATNIALGTPIVSDLSGSVSYSNNAPTQLPKGLTLVTWTARDASANFSTATQTVAVVDREPPAIVFCPTNRTVALGTNCSMTVPDLTHELIATDNCGGLVTITQAPPATAFLKLGTNPITLFVSDSSSNSVTCQTTLTLSANPPVASTDQLRTVINAGLSLPAQLLLTNDVVADGRMLQAVVGVSGSSTHAGQVSLVGTNLVYLPPTNFVGSDAFTYTNTDCAGLSASGTVFVIVDPLPHSFNLVSLTLLTNLTGTTAAILLQGSPGYSYTLQRATNVSNGSVIWTNLSFGAAASSGTNAGLLIYYDTNPPSPAYYRARQP